MSTVPAVPALTQNCQRATGKARGERRSEREGEETSLPSVSTCVRVRWHAFPGVCVCVRAYGWLTETYLSCRLVLWGPGMSDSIKTSIWLGDFDVPLESCRLSHPIEHKLASTLTNRHRAACWPLTTKHKYKSIFMSSLFTKHGCQIMTYSAESVWGTLEKSLRF